MSAWGKQIGLGVALVGAVALVTLLFSFLGTIACAALVGMMAGATRQWRWQIIPVSLVFPGVIAGFMHFTKTNLTSQQNLALPLVCFGAFWLTYMLTCALPYFEKQSSGLAAESADKPAAPMATPQPVTGTNLGAQDRVISTPPVVRAEALCNPTLAELQGRWLRETAGLNGESCQKLIEVAQDKLAWSVVGLDGQSHVLCRGDVRLEKLGPFKILKVLDTQAGASVVSAGRSELSETWIYRIAGRRLVLASNLDGSADGQESRMETYIKL